MAKQLEKISKNVERLAVYPSGKNVRVAFANMPFKVPPKSVYEAYAAKVDGILNIQFHSEKNRRNGKGNFIMRDPLAAEKLIRL